MSDEEFENFSFNSTLVQLKVPALLPVNESSVGFNSTLVQLKVSLSIIPLSESLVSILP